MTVVMVEKPSLDEALLHFGTKGMRWGIRKNRTTDTLTKAERQEAKKNFKKEGGISADRVLNRRFGDGEKSLAHTPYSKLSSEDRTIKAGAEFFRVSSRKDEVFRDKTFVSTNKEDHDRYKALLPKGTFGWGGQKSYKLHYEQTLKLTKDLKLPSEKARVDAFNEILNSKSVQVGRKTMTGKEYLKRQGYGKHVDSIEKSNLGKKAFDDMNTTATFATPLNTAYFNKLKSKGYNAIVDDNDRGVLTKDPLILLDPTGTLAKTNVRQLTARDINDAQRNFKAHTEDGRRTSDNRE